MDRAKVLKDLSEDGKIKDSGTHITLGASRPPIEWFSTGNYALDWCISNKLYDGGLPLGRVIELFGDPSAGKSLIVARIMGEVQAAGGIAIYDDVEAARDEVFMKKMGCDTSPGAMITAETQTVEEHFKFVMQSMDVVRDKKFEGPMIIVLDSLAALSTKHEMETGLDKVDMTRAKVIKAAMRLVGGELNRKRVLYIACNHTIANIGAPKYAEQSTSPGGGGVKFHASVRIELDVREKYRNEVGLVTGVRVQAEVVKNKLTPPFRACNIKVDFERGIDQYSGLFEVLVKAGVVTHTGAGWYLYKDSQKKMREDEIMEIVKKEVEGGRQPASSVEGGK